ncbi:MAG: hypothetical protein ACYCZM_07595 [Acidimicrobiales bacterium]
MTGISIPAQRAGEDMKSSSTPENLSGLSSDIRVADLYRSNQESMRRTNMSFPRPARRFALGFAAIGIALASAGVATAATAMIQPAGALSAQVPAVGVREQNVNSAGRIRVALPASQVPSGVHLPLNAAGRVQTQNGTGVSHEAFLDQSVGAAPVTWVMVSGKGIFEGVGIGNNGRGNPSNSCQSLTIIIDGQNVFADGAPLASDWFGNNGELSSQVGNGVGGTGMQFWPRGGLPFQKSLQIVTSTGCNSAFYTVGRAWYTTAG